MSDQPKSRVIRRTEVLLDQNVTFNQPETDAEERLPQHVVKLAFGYKCTLCQAFPGRRHQVDEHVGGREHVNKLSMLLLKNNIQYALANKNHVSVEMRLGGVVHEKQTLLTFPVTKKVEEALTVTITNHGSTAVQMGYCNFTVPSKGRVAVFTIITPNGPTCIIPPNGSINVVIKILANNVGKYPKSLFMKFSDGLEAGEFYIIRQLTAVCSSDVIDILKPTEPFKHIARTKIWPKNKEIVPGFKLARSTDDALEISVQLTSFRIPPAFRSAVNHGLTVGAKRADANLQREIARIRDVMLKKLTFASYEEKWTVLLRLEKLQSDINVQQFTMEDVTMTVCRENTRFLVLTVPGLAENRPSLLKGDILFASLVDESANECEYEGYVHNILQTEVWLGFGEKLRSKFDKTSIKEKKFDVRFVVPEHVFRLQQRAVTMAAKIPELSPILFPAARSDEQQNRPPPMLALNTRITYYNQDVAGNNDQANAVLHIVAGTSRPAPYLLFGPPGTGKTVTLVESILQTLRFHANAHILACAPSNSAADLLTERLASYLKNDGKDASKTLFRIHARSRSWITVSEYIKGMSNYRGGDYYYPSKTTIANYRVVITTLATAGRLVSAKFPAGHFTHLFIDECGQATEPECVIAMAGVLSYNTTDYPKGGQVVLAGDPKQLGPIVHSPYANKFGLEKSFLERLMLDVDVPMYKRREGTNPPYDVTVMTELRKNYRSHPAILDQPNRQFYHGDLEYAADKRQRDMFVDWAELPKRGFPVIFHGTMGEEMREGNSPSFYNPQEIDIVLDYVDKLLVRRSQEFKTGDIAIITPYRKQVQKLQKLLRRRKLDSIKVGTVEEFQGQERPVIIMTTVRSNPDYLEFDTQFKLGFVANPKKYNVAITRAKSLLIVVGNPRCLNHDLYWNGFIEYCRRNDALIGVEMLDEFDLPDLIRQMLNFKLECGSGMIPECVDMSVYYTAPELPRENILLVENLQQFRACTAAISVPGKIVGIDAEWTPTFISGTVQTISILQLAVDRTVYILDIGKLLRQLPPTEWKTWASKFFNNSDVTKVGYQVASDLSILLETFPNLKDLLHPDRLVSLVDLYVRNLELERIPDFYPTPAFGAVNSGSHELSEVVRKTLGKPLYKAQQLCNWDSRPLTQSQITYAALDAYALLGVYDHIVRRMRELNVTNVNLFKKLNNKFWNNLFRPKGH